MKWIPFERFVTNKNVSAFDLFRILNGLFRRVCAASGHDSPTFTFVAAHFRRCHATIDKMLQTNFNDFNFSISFIFRVRLISSISIRNLCSMIELSLGFWEFFTHSKWHCSEKFYFQHLNHLWWWSFWFYVRMKIKFADS